MDKIIKEQIEFKINEIDKLFFEYDLIFKKLESETPDKKSLGKFIYIV